MACEVERFGFQLCMLWLLVDNIFMPCLARSSPNIATDQSALLSIKSNILSGNEVLETNWSTSGDVCSWIGVTCGKLHHRVVSLNLSGMDVAGTLPSQVGNLSFLASIDISYNRFHGPVPRELAALPRLTSIRFQFNNFGGDILFLFGMAPVLEILNLRHNSFTGSIPSSIFNVSSLKRVLLEGNAFTGHLPFDMCGRGAALELLTLGTNGITGSIPRGIQNCTSLVALELMYNKLTGPIPQELASLPNIAIINLGNNDLSGDVPTNLFNISGLQVLSLVSNSLTGKVPLNLGVNLPNLLEFDMGINYLNGEVLYSITNASKLQRLDLSNNSFTGYIPKNMGDLRHLQVLNLQSNFFMAESSSDGLVFLSSLTNCKELEVLSVASNPLNGVLPSSIGNFSALKQLYLGDCSIAGNVREEIGNLSSLIILTFQRNEFTGPIPATIADLMLIQGLDLSENKLQGSIPAGLCGLHVLNELYLGINRISGSIPLCISNLTSLQVLALNSNQLHSVIPSTLWSLGDFLTLNLSTNSLTGNLPSEIGNLKVVRVLDLSVNQFQGIIPSTLGGLQSLESLNLKQNRLNGPIPPTFGGMLSLTSLDLSVNHLSGMIPSSLANLSNLLFLNLSYNNLEGQIPSAGPFAKFSSESFMMNKQLCGEAQFLVPPCMNSSSHGKKKRPLKVVLIYVLPALSVTVAMLYVLCVDRSVLREDTRISTELQELPGAELRKFTQEELSRATEGFGESNLIGRGGFGSVYRGVLSDGTHVAVKVFNFPSESASKSFDNECEILRNIRHRNLVSYISSCSNTMDFKALVLKYMVNGSLEKWLHSPGHFLDVMQRLSIMKEVALALEYLHHDQPTPILHRDLKPSNVLLDQDMVAHVSDFGISKLFAEGEYTRQTMTFATVGYMAPEYGSEGMVCTASDVYSFGILLMETFTRKRPTDGMFKGDLNLRHWVQESIPVAIDEVADAELLRRDEQIYAAKKTSILAVLELALTCSTESPLDRISIKDASIEITKITENLQTSAVNDSEHQRHMKIYPLASPSKGHKTHSAENKS